MLRITRDHFLYNKKFPKLVFLKAVSVTMIANSEKVKMKKTFPCYDICISSSLPLLVFPADFLKNCSHYPVFWIIPPSKEGVGGGRKLFVFI